MILTVARVKDDYTQEEIGEKIGWSRSKVAQYIRLLKEIVTPILDIARKHQEDRVTKDVTHVTFNFTEYWFRKQVADYSRLTSSVVPPIVKIAKNNQLDRGTNKVPDGTLAY